MESVGAALCQTDYSVVEGMYAKCVECGSPLGVWTLGGINTPVPCRDCFPDEYESQAAIKRQDEQMIALEFLRLGSQLSPRFKTCTIDSYQIYDKAQRGAVAKCRHFAENFPDQCQQGGMLLFAMMGGCGTGKGHLAAGICNAVMERHSVSCLYLKYYEIVNRIKWSWNPNSTETEKEIIDQVRGVDLLVLDEIGVQYSSPTEKLFLYTIVDHRYEWYRPTIITTNLTVDQLENVAGTRIISRLSEKGNSILDFSWADYRQRQ